MQILTASNAKQQFGALLDTVQRQPVTIKRQNREVAVMLSPEDYHRLRGANISQFQQFCDRISDQAKSRGLTERRLGQLLSE